MKSRKMKRHGFTLIELLVVIAIIALLLAILMPSLQTVKTMAQGIVCISNTKTLSLGATLFAQDNDDAVPQSSPSEIDDPDRQSQAKKGWVTRPNDVGGNNVNAANSTRDDRIRGVEGGTLYRYIGDHKVYHCQGDKRFKDTYDNYLSFSMPGSLNPNSTDRAHYVNKLSQITLPSTKYIFLEESDPRPYFSGSWSFGVKEHDRDGWWDGLAIWHNNASTFGYADGHAGSHKWRDDYTRTRAGWTLADLNTSAPEEGRNGNGSYGYLPYAGNEAVYNHIRNDLNWMQDAWPYSK